MIYVINVPVSSKHGGEFVIDIYGRFLISLLSVCMRESVRVVVVPVLNIDTKNTIRTCKPIRADTIDVVVVVVFDDTRRTIETPAVALEPHGVTVVSCHALVTLVTFV